MKEAGVPNGQPAPPVAAVAVRWLLWGEADPAGWVTEEEIGEAARYRSDADRRRFLCGRAAARRLIRERNGLERALFVRTGAGKPVLSPPAGIDFSISHSGDFVVVALAAGGRVGVDIERGREGREVRRLAARWFSAEEAAQVEADPAAFLDLWARKEAFVKALGEGVAAGLSTFTLRLRRPGVYDVSGAAGAWTVRDIHVASGYACAVAADRAEFEVDAGPLRLR